MTVLQDVPFRSIFDEESDSQLYQKHISKHMQMVDIDLKSLTFPQRNAIIIWYLDSSTLLWEKEGNLV